MIAETSTRLQNWKGEGRRLVQIGGVLPIVASLVESLKRIFYKRLAATRQPTLLSSRMLLLAQPSPRETM